MITYSVLRLPARRTSLTVRIPKLESAPVSVKRVELNRSPRHRGYGRWMALVPSRSCCRDVLGRAWQVVAAATRRSNRQPIQDSPLCSARRHPIVLREASIRGPISRGFQHGAVGTPISLHDVSGAGWQTPGRVTQPITTMMPT
jgi:hypothetical protein